MGCKVLQSDAKMQVINVLRKAFLNTCKHFANNFQDSTLDVNKQ